MITTSMLSTVDTAVRNSVLNNFLYVGFGTGTTPPTLSDTSLQAQVIRKARQEYSETVDTLTISGFLDTGDANGSTIGEIGTFLASSGGNVLDRFVLNTPLAKTSAKQYWVDISVKRTVSEE